jgi:hypothetical protein
VFSLFEGVELLMVDSLDARCEFRQREVKQ